MMKICWRAVVALATVLLALAGAQAAASSSSPVPFTDTAQPLPKAHLHFGNPTASDSGGPSTNSVAVADLNGDGKLDLVVTNECQSVNCDAPGEVAVLLGNGDGTFQPAVTYGTGAYYADSVTVGDMNGDGKPDLLVANLCSGTFCTFGTNGSGMIGVLLGNGDGTFQPVVTYSSGGVFAFSVATADLKGDGKLDLVVANNCRDNYCEDGSVSVLSGNGDGIFQPAITYDAGGYDTDSVLIADVNNDGHPDLIVSNFCESNQCGPNSFGTVGVLLGNGDGSFKPGVNYVSNDSYAYSVAVADLRGNGKLDLVMANQCQGNRGGFGCPTSNVVDVLLGNGEGTFQAAITYLPTGWEHDSVVIGDVNGDGYPDLVVVNECQHSSRIGDCVGTGQVSVLLGNGDGTFQAPVKFGSGGYRGSSIAIGDVNGDGRPDIVVTNAEASAGNYNNGSVAVLLNETSYTTKATLSSSANPSHINQTVTFTAAITSNPPLPNGEMVTFYSGKTKLGTGVTANGLASLSTSFSKLGTYSIKAKYPGDAFRKASSGLMTQVVNP
jgi:hypothetical protein